MSSGIRPRLKSRSSLTSLSQRRIRCFAGSSSPERVCEPDSTGLFGIWPDVSRCSVADLPLPWSPSAFGTGTANFRGCALRHRHRRRELGYSRSKRGSRWPFRPTQERDAICNKLAAKLEPCLRKGVQPPDNSLPVCESLLLGEKRTSAKAPMSPRCPTAG